MKEYKKIILLNKNDFLSAEFFRKIYSGKKKTFRKITTSRFNFESQFEYIKSSFISLFCILNSNIFEFFEVENSCRSSITQIWQHCCRNRCAMNLDFLHSPTTTSDCDSAPCTQGVCGGGAFS